MVKGGFCSFLGVFWEETMFSGRSGFSGLWGVEKEGEEVEVVHCFSW